MTTSTVERTFAEKMDEWLKDLSPADGDTYTRELRSIVLDNDLVSQEWDVENYFRNAPSPEKRFAAFYMLLIICREYRNYSRYNHYVDDYAEEFENYPLYLIIRSTYYRHKAILGEKDGYRKAVEFAEEACKALPSNLAVKNHYASVVASALEEKISVDPADIQKATERLATAMDKYPKDAKYFCTRGRILAATGDYDGGIRDLRKALDLESGTTKDSMQRIGEYNYYLLQIKLMQESDQVEKKMGLYHAQYDEIAHNMDGIKTQYLEYLAFFSSILAFLLSTFSVAGTMTNFNQGAGIILMAAGALVLIFGLFRMLLYFSSEMKLGVKRVTLYCLAGLGLLVVGFLVGNQMIL